MTQATHELTISFLASSAKERLAVKRELVSWLNDRDITNYAESFVDGVDQPIGDEYNEDDAHPLTVYEDDPAALDALAEGIARIFGRHISLKRTILSREAWEGAWAEDFLGMTTERFVVGEKTSDASKQWIKLVQGHAFGRGDHATTEACLRALEALPPPPGATRFLDVGTGNGILAIAAMKLGYAHAVGTDIDEAILDEARENAELNGLAISFVREFSVPVGRFWSIAANIPAPVLHDLMPSMAKALLPGGALLLAGFIAKEQPSLDRAAIQNGLVPRSVHEVRGWLGLTYVNSREE